jgi:hypothetical protein
MIASMTACIVGCVFKYELLIQNKKNTIQTLKRVRISEVNWGSRKSRCYFWCWCVWCVGACALFWGSVSKIEKRIIKTE